MKGSVYWTSSFPALNFFFFKTSKFTVQVGSLQKAPYTLYHGYSQQLCKISSVQFSHSVMSNYLQPHGMQHARLPCPSQTPRVYSNSCPLSRWCHPTTSPSVIHPLLLPPSIFPSIKVFFSELALRIRWPKYWSFSFRISPSNECSGPISFRMDWLFLLAVQAVQGTLKSLLQYHSSTPQFFCTQLSF